MSQESRYSKVFVKIWHSKDFRAISEDGKMLFMYLLSSPHRNMGGFYYLPLPYLCYDVGLDEKRITKALQELADRDMALYDFDTQVVLIKKWFCYNPIENENQAKGLNKQLAEIPKSKLFKPFVNCVKEYCKYIESILKGFDIPSENPSETLSKPYTKPGTGTGTGSVSVTGDIYSPNPPVSDEPLEPEKTIKPDAEIILDHWNSKDIIQHRKLTDKIKRAINGALRNYSADEICAAIDNYNTILTDEKYYWSYKWTLQDFLQRGLEKFIDFETAAQNYQKDNPKSRDKPAHRDNFQQHNYGDDFFDMLEKKSVIGIASGGE